MARAMVERPSLKAVWLNSESRKVSFAFEPGADGVGESEELERLVAGHRPDELPGCAGDRWHTVCEICEKGRGEALPPGIRMIAMPDAGVMLEKETCPTSPRFWKWRQMNWVRLQTRRMETVRADDHDHHHDWRISMGMAAACGACTLAGFLLAVLGPPPWQPYAIPLYLLAFIAGAWHPAIEVWELLRRRVLDIHFLMLCVALGAAFIGHWWEGAVLLFLFSLSGALEELALERTRREIRSLFKDAPKVAIRLDASGREETVDVDRIEPGMLLRVRPGEQFPVDATVAAGESGVDESTLTGESVPIDKTVGSRVFSGTLNTWGALDVRVLKRPSESALARIIKLIHEAQESKAPSQSFTDKFGTRYTYGVLVLSFVMFFVWWLGFGLPPFLAEGGAMSAFYRTMTLLVVASPCALVLSIPSAILAGIASGARRGILFRGGIAIEDLARIDRVAMDKTGTLTTGELSMVTVEANGCGEEDILRAAAALAGHSAHPVSRALHLSARERSDRDLPRAAGFRSVTGLGLEGELDGARARLGSRRMFEAEPWIGGYAPAGPGVSETFVQWGDVHGRILLKDTPRMESRNLVGQLRGLGVRTAMLTGDREQAASAVAAELGLDEFRADLRPEDKVQAIREWQRAGESVAMIGDGVNDAPALAAADVSVGMGLRGSDAVLEQADVVLMKDRLENFNTALLLSRKARRVIRQNLAVSLGVIAVLVVGALGAGIPLTLGVIGHEGSTVVVVMNSLRLLLGRLR